jgi:enoyl-CoA hydratase
VSPTTKSTLGVRHKGPVVRLRLQRPRAGNRIDEELARRLCDEAQEIEQDDGVAVVVLEAEGEAFCRGVEDGGVWEDRFDFVDAIGRLGCPVVAAVHGDAVAEGMELVLACDLRLFARTVRCALPQIRSGALPRHGGTQRLPRIAGRTRAMDLLLTGRTIEAVEAERMGIATQVFRRTSFDRDVDGVIAALVDKGPVALRYAKEAIRGGAEMTFDQGVRLEQDLYALLQTTRDRQEGIASFLEKRRPRFRGK